MSENNTPPASPDGPITRTWAIDESNPDVEHLVSKHKQPDPNLPVHLEAAQAARERVEARTPKSTEQPGTVPYNHELFLILSSHGLTLVDDELHQIARAAARCYPEVWAQVHNELPGAGGAATAASSEDWTLDAAERVLRWLASRAPLTAHAVVGHEYSLADIIRECAPSKPASSAPLKAILAAAERANERWPHMGCLHIHTDGLFCGIPGPSHPEPAGHPFVSLTTLLSSVAELASARADEVTAIARDALAAPDEIDKLQRQLAETGRQRDLLQRDVDALRAVVEEAQDAAEGRSFDPISSLAPRIVAIRQQRDSHLAVCRSIAAKVDSVFSGDPSFTLEKRVAWVCDRAGQKPGAQSINTQPPAAYRLLETGEIIQEGDQWRTPHRDWSVCTVDIGIPKPSGVQHRRPITGGAGLHEAATCDQQPMEEEHESLPGFENTGIIARLSAFEDAASIISELPPTEARAVISALATVFSV